HPHAADVNTREDRGANDRKQCHRFSRAVDRGPPFLATEVQNGRDQGSSVTDADPEYEVRDVPGPADRDVIAPDADAGEQEIKHAECPKSRKETRDADGNPPPKRRFVLYNPGDPIRDPCHRMVVQNERAPWHPLDESDR